MALKDQLPLTAAFAAARRAEMSAAHVTAMIKRAQAGEAGRFYSVERVAHGQYRAFGTPFELGSKDRALFAECLLYGLEFAAVIRPSEGARNGTH
jgi:hypothetical protein